MGLEIKKINDVFYLKGNINSATVQMLKSHFNYTFDLGVNIILNLDGVADIDEMGMKALEEFSLYSQECHQRLCITGIKFQQLYSANKAA